MSTLKELNLEIVFNLLRNEDISGWFKNNNGGPYLQKFEKIYADYVEAKHAIVVASGSTSIYTALKAIGVDRDDLVAVPSYTHIGSAAPIVLAGGIPLFVDVDEYGNFSAEDLMRYLDKDDLTYEGKKLKAIVVVHQLGMPCDVDRLPKGIPVIEDASHALGSKYKGRYIGNLGKLGCFSIGGGRTKTIGTGEGGMIVTNDPELAERCHNMRNHGDRSMDCDYFCFNFRMSELNAMLGYLQMVEIQKYNDWQMKNAKYIMENLPDYLEVPPTPDYAESVRYIIGCIINEDKAGMTRNEFLAEIRRRGFEGGIPRKFIGSGYTKLLSDVKYYQQFPSHSLPGSRKLIDKAVWIDWHRYPRSREEIDELLEVFWEIVK